MKKEDLKTVKEILREEIKERSEKQVFYKNQRKTVNLKGERVISSGEAQIKAFFNKYKLRILFASYGVLCGKKFSEIENSYPEENHPLLEFKKEIEEIIGGDITLANNLYIESMRILEI
ncbi:MAG: hypothetical protein ACOC1K_01565 [Nanoarchaeota archaeon]